MNDWFTYFLLIIFRIYIELRCITFFSGEYEFYTSLGIFPTSVRFFNHCLFVHFCTSWSAPYWSLALLLLPDISTFYLHIDKFVSNAYNCFNKLLKRYYKLLPNMSLWDNMNKKEREKNTCVISFIERKCLCLIRHTRFHKVKCNV